MLSSIFCKINEVFVLEYLTAAQQHYIFAECRREDSAVQLQVIKCGDEQSVGSSAPCQKAALSTAALPRCPLLPCQPLTSTPMPALPKLCNAPHHLLRSRCHCGAGDVSIRSAQMIKPIKMPRFQRKTRTEERDRPGSRAGLRWWPLEGPAGPPRGLEHRVLQAGMGAVTSRCRAICSQRVSVV